MADAIAQKRPELTHVIFLHDNARPQVAKFTSENSLKLDGEVLPHPPYSSDLASTETSRMAKRLQLMNWKLLLVTSSLGSLLTFTRVSMTYHVFGRWLKITVIILMFDMCHLLHCIDIKSCAVTSFWNKYNCTVPTAA